MCFVAQYKRTTNLPLNYCLLTPIQCNMVHDTLLLIGKKPYKLINQYCRYYFSTGIRNQPILLTVYIKIIFSQAGKFSALQKQKQYGYWDGN